MTAGRTCWENITPVLARVQLLGDFHKVIVLKADTKPIVGGNLVPQPFHSAASARLFPDTRSQEHMPPQHCGRASSETGDGCRCARIRPDLAVCTRLTQNRSYLSVKPSRFATEHRYQRGDCTEAHHQQRAAFDHPAHLGHHAEMDDSANIIATRAI